MIDSWAGGLCGHRERILRTNAAADVVFPFFCVFFFGRKVLAHMLAKCGRFAGKWFLAESGLSRFEPRAEIAMNFGGV